MSPRDSIHSSAFAAAACSAVFLERAHAVKRASSKLPCGVDTAGIVKWQVNFGDAGGPGPSSITNVGYRNARASVLTSPHREEQQGKHPDIRSFNGASSLTPDTPKFQCSNRGGYCSPVHHGLGRIHEGSSWETWANQHQFYRDQLRDQFITYGSDHYNQVTHIECSCRHFTLDETRRTWVPNGAGCSPCYGRG